MVKVKPTANQGRITVKTSNDTNIFSIKDNLSEYYAKQAENWAHSEGIVNGIDYSSKYYAEQSKASAQVASDVKTETQELVDGFDNKVQIAKDDIEQNRINSINAIENTYSVAVEDMQEKSDEVLTNIETSKVEAIERLKQSSTALTQSQITNCLLEVPQNIKLELNNGTLIIKAGSIVTIPYGTTDLSSTYKVGSDFLNSNLKVVDRVYSNGKFFVWAELQTDKQMDSTTQATANQRTVTVVVSSGNLASIDATAYNSGATEPEGLSSSVRFYNTTANYIYNGGTTTYHSYPICVGQSVNGTGWTSIDKVFNGMGYIGSTVWVDKGVKCLIPNGRNEDGSLRNIESTLTKVCVITDTRVVPSGKLVLTPSSITNGSAYCVDASGYTYSEEEPTTARWYKPSANMFYLKKDDGWKEDKQVHIGDFSKTTTSFTSFQPKQPFRAVDYNDIYTKNDVYTKTEADNRYVDITGDTMTGALAISMQGRPDINLYNKTLDQAMTTAPSSTQYYGAVRFFDKSNRLTGQFSSYTDTGNNANCAISAMRNVNGTNISSTFTVMVKPDGTQTCAATASVKSEITSWSYPSTTKVTNPIATTITKGGNHTYTAPCDGMLTFQYGSTTGANAVLVYINGIQVLHIGDSISSTHRMSGTLLVSKGMVIKINTDTREASGGSCFWYAKGTKV